MIAEAIPRESLSKRDQADMFAVLDRHFFGVDLLGFDADLEEKNWVVLMRDERGTLKGFSTLLFYRAHFRGEDLRIVYSGDTIVDRSAWGSFALPKAWIEAVWSVEPPNDKERLLWMLITSGFRTYRFLPVFWKRFSPHHKEETPEPTAELMQHLAQTHFGSRYDPTTGVVQLDRPQALRGALSEIPAGKLANPHIRCFARLNPGWARGDELLCLAELSPENLTRAGRRMVGGATAKGEVQGAA